MKKKEIIIILLTFILPLLVIVPMCFTACGTKKAKEQPVVVPGKKTNPAICEHPDGIDLSHHNVAYDWKKVDAQFV